MKKKIGVCISILLIWTGACLAQKKYPFQDPKLSIDKRVENLVSLLTTPEKIEIIAGVDTSNKGISYPDFAVPRLGIVSPGNAESIHQVKGKIGSGVKKINPSTSFAQVKGMGETWDPELIKQAGAVMGYEARYISQNENYKNNSLVLWGPTADLARDPRWGRNDESFGEDPFFTGTMAVALIKGIQGDNPTYWQAASLMKHVFANSNETIRSHSSSDFDQRLMREYYSVPFRMGFTEGGAKSYMLAYNAWNGIPMTVNPVAKNVLAKEWGADGIVSSDAGAIELVVNQHHYMKDAREVMAAAVKLGMNQFIVLPFNTSAKKLVTDCLDQHLLTEADLNNAIAGKIKTIIKLGLLDPPSLNPYAKIGVAGEPEPWNSEKHKTVALKVARESVVLLKNSGEFLPLQKEKIKSIAIIGPRAAQVSPDFYSSSMPYSVSVLQGIKNKLGDNIVIRYIDNFDLKAAVAAAKESDITIVVAGNDPMCGTINIGEAFNMDGSTKPCPECGDGREGRDRQSLDLPAEDMIKEVYAVNPKTIVVLLASFPYAINWSQAHVPAILQMTHAAQEQGTAVADVLFGDYNPAGRLVQTWPTSLAQLPRMMEYDIRNGRTYLYSKDAPLYPFGYGLSYTKFSYADLKLSAFQMTKDGNVNVSVDVKNEGSRDGDEVVQLYVQFPQSKVVRPVKELKAFQRMTIKTGETKTFQFTLKASSLAWWNEVTNSWEVESGPLKILVGSSSADTKGEKEIDVR